MPSAAWAIAGQPFALNPAGIVAGPWLDLTWRQPGGTSEFLVLDDVDGSVVTVGLDYVAPSGETVETRDCEVRFVHPTSPRQRQYVMCLGDSTTAGIGAAGGRGWVAECQHLLTGGGSSIVASELSRGSFNLTNIEFVGTLGDDDGRHEGRGGWGFGDYLRAEARGEVNNAFHRPGTGFDLRWYLDRHGFDQIDSDGGNLTIVIQLGWNHVYIDDDWAGDAQALVDRICGAAPQAQVILLGLPPPPADPISKQFTGERRVSRRHAMLDAVLPASALYESIASRRPRVEHLAVAPYFFPDGAFPTVTVRPTLRSAREVSVVTDYVHPNEQGYAQIADIVVGRLLHLVQGR